MRLFNLVRTDDVSGVSGVGIIAQGVVFDNGKAVLNWLTEFESQAIYPSIDELIKIHGHEGRTKVVYLDVLTYQIALDTTSVDAAIEDVKRRIADLKKPAGRKWSLSHFTATGEFWLFKDNAHQATFQKARPGFVSPEDALTALVGQANSR